MLLRTWVTGPLMVNTYLILCEDSKEGAVIDPGGDEEKILQFFVQHKTKLKYIINTHGHPDHIVGNSYLKEKTQAAIVIHEKDAPMLTAPDPLIISMMQGKYTPTPADIKINENDEIKIGKLNLKVVHTPGHTPGGISLLAEDFIFTGDTLFAGGIGRTDFPGGSYPTLISSIKDKLFSFDHTLKILPGHGPTSTLKEEREYNPFLT